MKLAVRYVDAPPTYPAWAATFAIAYAAAQSSDGQAHVAVFGDSVTQGYYTTTPYYTNSFTGEARDALAVVTGVTPGTGMVPMCESVSVPSVGEDRFVFSGTWSTAATSGYFGENRRGSANASVTFTATCESFRVHYIQATADVAQSFGMSVDGGAVTTVGTVIGSGFGQSFATISAGSLGSHTLTITVGATSNRFVFLAGVEGIANSTTGVKFSRVGDSGAPVSDLIANAFSSSSLPCVTALAPDLAVLAFGLNDAYNGVSVATFTANMETAIAAFQAVGSSVAIMVSPPPDPAYIAAGVWDDYVTAMSSIATDNGCGLFDVTARWVDYSTSSALYFDTVHPNAAGHADIGTALAEFIIDSTS